MNQQDIPCALIQDPSYLSPVW